MYKVIVIPVILFLFVLQTNNLLFASESTETKAEVSIVTTEANVEESVTTVAETEESNAAVTEVESTTKESTMVVVEKETNTEESATTVTEAVESTETVVEKEAETEESNAAVTAAESTTKESTSSVAEKEVKSEEGTQAVVETENDVIATVNSEEILRKDFDRRLNVFRRMNQDVTPEIKKQVVGQLTKKMLLKQFVDKQDISAGKEEVQAEIEKIKFFLQNNPNNKDKPLDEILEGQGSSLSELEEEVSRALALSKYLENSVSDADKRSYFDANKDAFNGARVKASHVLIDTRNLKTDAEREEAKKKIEIVKVEIDKGADFAEMAKKYSNCPSAEKGGDIGFFQRKGSIVEEFAVVAFAMEVGEISEPVKTQFGYHIIMVTEKEEGEDVRYEDVTDMVDFVYMQIKTEDLVKELNDKAEIKIML